jgi:hypothetical protein
LTAISAAKADPLAAMMKVLVAKSEVRPLGHVDSPMNYLSLIIEKAR